MRRVLPVWPAAVLGPLAIALTAMIFAVSEAKIRTVGAGLAELALPAADQESAARAEAERAARRCRVVATSGSRRCRVHGTSIGGPPKRP